MTIQTTKPLTIKEYAASQRLSETTVRRRIRSGVIDARLEHGRYFIYEQTGVQSGDAAHTQNEYADKWISQANDRVNSQVPYAESPEHTDQKAVIDRLTSEVDYLRGQLDKQTHLLVASTAQNSDMLKQLYALSRPSLVEKDRKMFDRRSAGSPDAPKDVEVS